MVLNSWSLTLGTGFVSLISIHLNPVRANIVQGLEGLILFLISPNRLRSSEISENRVVFNVKGNNYRIACAMDYSRQAMYIKFT